MKRPFSRRGLPPRARRYGWRDVAAVLGVYAILLQIGLGVVAGLAGEAIARERTFSGSNFNALALDVCSPSGLIQLADDAGNAPARGAPVCPGCLVAHGGPVPPTVVVLPREFFSESKAYAAFPETDGPAAIARITALNPRAPPAPRG